MTNQNSGNNSNINSINSGVTFSGTADITSQLYVTISSTTYGVTNWIGNTLTLSIADERKAITQEDIDIQAEILYDLKRYLVKQRKVDKLRKWIKIHPLQIIEHRCCFTLAFPKKFDEYVKRIEIIEDKICIQTFHLGAIVSGSYVKIDINDPNFKSKVYDNIKDDTECPIRLRLGFKRRLLELFTRIFK